MVPPDSHRISRVPRYSGVCYASYGFVYWSITIFGAIFQTLPLTILLAILQSYNPNDAGTSVVWALPRSLATTWGIIFYFLFLRVLRCFSSPRSLTTLVVRLSFRQPGCPIRKFTNQRLFAPPRDLSQLITSFIACKSLGIHRTPFLTCLPLLYCY